MLNLKTQTFKMLNYISFQERETQKHYTNSMRVKLGIFSKSQVFLYIIFNLSRLQFENKNFF